MSVEECYRVLACEHLGSVGLIVMQQPMVLPVNYALMGTTIIFRTARLGIRSARAGAEGRVRDQPRQNPRSTGWSVLARGTAIPRGFRWTPERSPAR
ncbi:MAG: pyridoxamine 5'-phosphate oxidase family protein [Ilumatobacteraceae bacterium]